MNYFKQLWSLHNRFEWLDLCFEHYLIIEDEYKREFNKARRMLGFTQYNDTQLDSLIREKKKQMKMREYEEIRELCNSCGVSCVPYSLNQVREAFGFDKVKFERWLK